MPSERRVLSRTTSYGLALWMGLAMATGPGTGQAKAITMEQMIRPSPRLRLTASSQADGYAILEASPQVKATPGFQALAAEIERLPHDDLYDAENPAPSQHSVARGRDFLAAALPDVAGDFPVADPVPDGLGGYRLFWARPGRNVQLDVPAAEDAPLVVFWREGVDYNLSENPSPADLAARLTWFVGD